ncbi:hypothetical protein AVEN_233667-1 [Araneus ventricosus]|uniref:Uncharacterized protein n=1 Tax=Araneus ventricosus TaxID=182803 RepID=A0A4Y2GKL0_ARAVE|nr:hypothetical protein AVEN_233667-1 [Araneus ventricosus]
MNINNNKNTLIIVINFIKDSEIRQNTGSFVLALSDPTQNTLRVSFIGASIDNNIPNPSHQSVDLNSFGADKNPDDIRNTGIFRFLQPIKNFGGRAIKLHFPSQGVYFTRS